VALNQRENIQASEFEILTATAFQLFNDLNVEIGVVEVGMGGKLDATNILNNQIVSVISKIAYDHQAFLGNTLEDIARHKAGILRPKIPYIVSPGNEWNVKEVISQVAKEIGAGPRISGATQDLRTHLFQSKAWHEAIGHLIPPLQDNAGLATLAVREALGGEECHPKKLQKLVKPLKNRQFPGRFHKTKVRAVFGSNAREILIDGAHNGDAAEILREVVMREFRVRSHKSDSGPVKPPRGGWPVTWVIAMSEGKDPLKFLPRLLGPYDKIVVTTFGPVDGMPWVKPMDPRKILETVESVRPDIIGMVVPELGAFRALCAAKYLTGPHEVIVVTGSLYLVGDLLREKRNWDEDENSIDVALIDRQERNRVNRFLTQKLDGGSGYAPESDSQNQDTIIAEEREKQKLEQEIKALNEQLQKLDEESAQLTAVSSQETNDAEIKALNEQLQLLDEQLNMDSSNELAEFAAEDTEDTEGTQAPTASASDAFGASEKAQQKDELIELRERLKWFPSLANERAPPRTFRILKHGALVRPSDQQLEAGRIRAHRRISLNTTRASIARMDGTESE
jgi:folylpolyglutamate synthase